MVLTMWIGLALGAFLVLCGGLALYRGIAGRASSTAAGGASVPSIVTEPKVSDVALDAAEMK